MAGDSNYPYVSLLLPCTGANNSTTFTDTSTPPKTATAVGNAKIVTTQVDPWGNSNGVLYLDGSGDGFTIPSNAGFDFAGGDFCIDGYIYRSTGSGLSTIIHRGEFTGYSAFSIYINSANKIGAEGSVTGSEYAFVLVGTTTITNGAWHHFELSRVGDNIYLFLDYTLEDSAVMSGSLMASTSTLKGGLSSNLASYPFNGYFSNIRITKAVGRHTSSFSAYTSAFADYAGQLTGNVTEGSYIYISKWLVKAWKSFSDTISKEQAVTGATYTLDLPTFDPYVLACAPYIDGKWEANKAVTLGQFYVASNPETSAHLWEVTTAGTFGATEATWNLSGTTTQGTAVLTYVGVLPNPSILGPKIPS